MIYRYQLGDKSHLKRRVDILYNNLKKADKFQMLLYEIISKERNHSTNVNTIGIMDSFNCFKNNLIPNDHDGLIFIGSFNGNPIRIGINLKEWVLFISSDADIKSIREAEEILKLQPCSDYDSSDESFYKIFTEHGHFHRGSAD